MSHHSVPFNWEWQQNPHNYSEVDPETGNPVLKNRVQRRSLRIEYLTHDVAKIPEKSPEIPSNDPDLQSLIALMMEAFEERPIWTRRAMMNRVSHSPHLNLARSAYQYVSYQFKNGPWREALVKHGVDPRTDPKYRIYQTIFFKIDNEVETGGMWKDKRPAHSQRHDRIDSTSHLFDGKKISLDGRVWQVCDITDPLLSRLTHDAPYPKVFNSKVDGWYQNGRFAKIKAIMKTKVIAIRLGKSVTDGDFATALSLPDFVSNRSSRTIYVPVPDLRLTAAELEALTKAGLVNAFSQDQILRRSKKKKLNTSAADVAGGKVPISRSRQKYIQGLWDMSEEAETPPDTPDSRAVEAASQISGMGMFDQAGTPGSGSSVYGRAEEGLFDDDLDEDEDEDDDDEPERESGSEEEEDEDDGDGTRGSHEL
jgi:general transcription factor 3C polypeptide 5 (transcription factor C subunit 1)